MSKNDVPQMSAEQRGNKGQVAPRKGSHFVYVMVNGDGLIKIGMSARPQKRIGSIRTASPVSVELAHTWRLPSRDAARSMEKALHALLKPRRAAREWHKIELDDARSVGNALVAGDVERAAAMAEAVCEMRRCFEEAKRLFTKRANMSPRWNPQERERLYDEADALDRQANEASERAIALGHDSEFSRWTKASSA